MRLAELYGARVRTADGRSIGRVREVHCRNGEVTEFGLGATTFLERLFGGHKGKRIAWSAVREIEEQTITVVVD